MAVAVMMPRQGQSVESCIIDKWYVQKGDKVNVGDILFSYETDKASFDEEATVDGVLIDRFYEEGDDVQCLTNVCVIGNPGEDASVFDSRRMDNTGTVREYETQAQRCVHSEYKNKPAVKAENDGEDRVKISPRAKKLAEKSGVDYRCAVPSGPDGRIVEKDIEQLLESGPLFTAAAWELNGEKRRISQVQGTGLGGRITTGDLENGNFIEYESKSLECVEPYFEEYPMTNIRKIIAKTMHNSIITTAQLTLNTSFDATALLELRKKLKETKDVSGLDTITLNDMILFAVSRVLKRHKELNAHLVGDRMIVYKHVNLGIAVETDRGLMVPTIYEAEKKSLHALSREIKKLADDCKQGTISPDDLKGASFTVTNLGQLGIESFTPVLNPPQTGILGVNAVVQRVREVDGEYKFYPAMGLSLTFDHRALDGGPAARFLADLKNGLENIHVLLAKG